MVIITLCYPYHNNTSNRKITTAKPRFVDADWNRGDAGYRCMDTMVRLWKHWRACTVMVAFPPPTFATGRTAEPANQAGGQPQRPGRQQRGRGGAARRPDGEGRRHLAGGIQLDGLQLATPSGRLQPSSGPRNQGPQTSGWPFRHTFCSVSLAFLCSSHLNRLDTPLVVSAHACLSPSLCISVGAEAHSTRSLPHQLCKPRMTRMCHPSFAPILYQPATCPGAQVH